MCVPTIHALPSGSTMVPQRSPQNIFMTGPAAVAPSFTARATVLSTFSDVRYRVAGQRVPGSCRRIPEMRFTSGCSSFVHTGFFAVAGFLRQAYRTLPHGLGLAHVPEYARTKPWLCESKSSVPAFHE